MKQARRKTAFSTAAALVGCLLFVDIVTVHADETAVPPERLREDIEALSMGGDFRGADWGATPDQVREAEQAEARGREHREEGAFSLLFVVQILNRTGEIRYFFDGKCGRLVGGSITFAEPVSEMSYFSIIKTFGNIYGEDGSIWKLINGGSYSTWRHDETLIALLHQPYGVDVRLQDGIDAPALMEKPPTSIFYRMDVERPENCDF